MAQRGLTVSIPLRSYFELKKYIENKKIVIVKSEEKRSHWIVSLQRRWLSFLVDLVDMDNVVTKAFDQHGLRTNNENLIDVGEIISILLTIFENVEKKRKDAISVLQCVDMTLNWLLNVYDRYHFIGLFPISCHGI